MIPTYNNIDSFEASDIKALIEGDVSESEQLDFKQQYAAKGRGKEFAKDISAMANSKGGAIIIGISEENAAASEVTGIGEETSEDLILALERAAEHNIRPRIPLKKKTLEVDGKEVVIIATPPSQSGPHMVTANSANKFYKRLQQSVEAMDVDEVRHSVLYSTTGGESAIASHELLLSELPNRRPTEYLIAFSFAIPREYGEVFTPEDDELNSRVSQAGKMLCGFAGPRIRFDGVDLHEHTLDGCRNHQYLKNTGEYQLCTYEELDDRKGGRHPFPGVYVKEQIDTAFRHAKAIYNIIGYDGPVYACMTIAGVKGLGLASGHQKLDMFHAGDFKQDVLTFAPVALDTSTEDWTPFTHDWLHRIWNGAGRSKCELVN